MDYYHACEHLADFASQAIGNREQRKEWMDRQKAALLESRLPTVVMEIKNCMANQPKTIKKTGKKLISYYTGNESRMDYQSFLNRGLQIGSGAIEAAHRTVIQKRMKLSGQRWTMKGAQNMLNLRTCFMSDKWVELIRKPAV